MSGNLSDKVDLRDTSIYEKAGLDDSFQRVWVSGIAQLITDIEATFNNKDHLVFQKSDISSPREKIRDEFNNVVTFNTDDKKSEISYTDDFVVEFDFSTRDHFLTIDYIIAATGSDVAERVENRIKELFPKETGKPLAEIRWNFPSEIGPQNVNFRNVINEDYYEEAYPEIDSLSEWTEDYIKSKSSLLFLYGPPGTGKTKLLRYIIKEASENQFYKNVPKVLYLSGEETASFESIFVDFLDQNYDFLIIEDLDQKVKPRSEGNKVMSTLLTASDGIVSSISKKVMITTNLPSLNKSRIDDALIRTGRCFDTKKLRKLSFEESRSFYQEAFGDKNIDQITEDTDYPLSDLYHLGENNTLPSQNKESESTGFHS